MGSMVHLRDQYSSFPGHCHFVSHHLHFSLLCLHLSSLLPLHDVLSFDRAAGSLFLTMQRGTGKSFSEFASSISSVIFWVWAFMAVSWIWMSCSGRKATTATTQSNQIHMARMSSKEFTKSLRLEAAKRLEPKAWNSTWKASSFPKWNPSSTVGTPYLFSFLPLVIVDDSLCLEFARIPDASFWGLPNWFQGRVRSPSFPQDPLNQPSMEGTIDLFTEHFRGGEKSVFQTLVHWA